MNGIWTRQQRIAWYFRFMVRSYWSLIYGYNTAATLIAMVTSRGHEVVCAEVAAELLRVTHSNRLKNLLIWLMKSDQIAGNKLLGHVYEAGLNGSSCKQGFTRQAKSPGDSNS